MKITPLIAPLLLALSFGIQAAEKAPDSVQKLVPTLKSWGQNSALIAAVKGQNAQGITLDQIKAQDKSWRAATGVNGFMKGLLSNSGAKELIKLESSAPYYMEIFLMDNQGANVSMTNKTSDYWQGDEAKFTKSFVGGSGAVHMGDVEFDESVQAYLVQVSVPVVENGKAIGAITVGVNIDELEK